MKYSISVTDTTGRTLTSDPDSADVDRVRKLEKALLESPEFLSIDVAGETVFYTNPDHIVSVALRAWEEE